MGTETHIRRHLGEPEELRDPTSHSPRWRPRERREDTLGEGTRRSVGPFLWATREIIGLGKPVYVEQLPVLEGIPPLLWEKLTESHLRRVSAPSSIPLQQVFLNASESHRHEPPNSLPGSSPQSRLKSLTLLCTLSPLTCNEAPEHRRGQEARWTTPSLLSSHSFYFDPFATEERGAGP